MPIYGFLEGYNEQQKAEADLDHTRANTLVNLANGQATQQRTQTEIATRAMLGDLASSQANGTALSDQYRAASQKLMAVNPDLAMKLGSQAELMDNREAQENLRRTNEELKKTGQFASMLASVDATTYQPMMLEWMAKGNDAPKWYTGNYETDKPFVQAAANAALTRQQQVEADNKAARLEAYQTKLEEVQRVHDLRNQQEANKLELAQQKAESLARYREGEQRRKDQELAAKQQKLERRESLVPKRDEQNLALSAVTNHPQLKELSSTDQTAVANEVAIAAKKALASGEEDDYQEALDNAMEEVAKRVKTEGLFPSWVPLVGGKTTLAPRTTTQSSDKIGGKGEVSTYSPAQEDWIGRAMKVNPGMSREQIIQAGKSKGKL